MNKKHLFRFLTSTLHPSFGGVGRGLTLMVCLLCALGAEAKDAYAVLSSDNTTLTFYYDNSINSRQGPKYFLNSVKDYPDWNKNVSQYSAPLPITTVIFDASFKDARPTTTNYWFYKFGNLTTITGISNLNTSKVTSMCSMFSYCSKLPTIDLNGFNTSLVTDMSYMFNQCSSLIQLDFTSFNTANVISMGYMFNGCSSLNSLAMTSFNTSKVTDMPGMFQSCRNLRLLDLRSFNTSNVSRTGWMFNECSSLQAIIVGDGWNTDAVEESSRMFVGCDNLVGEAGTTFSGNHIDV